MGKRDFTRRQFLAGTVAMGTGALINARISAAPDEVPILGEGQYRYRCLHDWGQLPETIQYGLTHGVAVDNAGQRLRPPHLAQDLAG